jgi:hypothetical protein
MGNRLTSGSTTVMTGMTGLAGHLGSGMIDYGILEALGIMATSTILCGRDVVTRFGQADHTIVTGCACILLEIQLGMVEYTRGKAARRMTDHAILGSRQMSLRGRWLAGGIVTIMTGSTAYAGHSGIRMINIGIPEQRGVMAGTTVLLSR